MFSMELENILSTFYLLDNNNLNINFKTFWQDSTVDRFLGL